MTSAAAEERAPLRFFVPGTTSDLDAEGAYARLAVAAGAPVRTRCRRIYSIRFVDKGITWVATVGMSPTGSFEAPAVSAGRVISQWSRRVDPATVLAIFPGRLVYLLSTDAGADSIFAGARPVADVSDVERFAA